MKVFNVFGNVYSGAWDKSFVAVVSRGTNYLRTYVEPSQPGTEPQREHRRRFAEACAAWKRLTPEERQAYDLEARRMSGYNLFVRRFLRGSRNARDDLISDRGDEESPVQRERQPEEL